MNVVTNGVSELIQREYEAAKAAHGPLASMHEGYAALLEEAEEVQEACEQIKEYLGFLWGEVRRNEPGYAKYNVDAILGIARETACEAIQVAAVAKRILDLAEKETDHEEDLRNL